MTSIERQTVSSRRMNFIVVADLIMLIVAAMLALIPLSGWASSYKPYGIPSTSMEPTIFQGDRVVVDRHYYATHRLADGDIIAFRHGDYVLLKRISALPGEAIEGRDGVLVRNGLALTEPYAQHSKDVPIPEIETFANRIVPSGQLFVTGDSRDHSLDSRSDEFGPVQGSDVVGKLVYIYWSTHAGQIGRSF